MTKDVEMEDVRKLAAETSRSVFYDRPELVEHSPIFRTKKNR